LWLLVGVGVVHFLVVVAVLEVLELRQDFL